MWIEMIQFIEVLIWELNIWFIIIFHKMEASQGEKTERKEKAKDKPRKRSESPVATKEDLMAKRI